MPEMPRQRKTRRAARRCCPFLPWVALGAFLLIWLGGCAPAAPTDAPLPAWTETPTPSPTTVWFPPTATPTPPQPLPTPTVAHLPIGQVLLDDPLLDATGWQLPQSAHGSVQVGDGRLVIALHRQNFSLISLRAEPVLDDFYLQVRVRLSLCQGSDSYGVLFRAQSPQDFYRLTLNCQHEIRLDRVQGGRRVYLQPPIFSADVPPVPPAEAVVGILAQGETIAVYLNDVLQFQVRDPVFRAGVVGVGATAQSGSDMTIVFSELQIYDLQP